MLNNKGDKIPPCLTPFDVLNKNDLVSSHLAVICRLLYVSI